MAAAIADATAAATAANPGLTIQVITSSALTLGGSLQSGGSSMPQRAYQQTYRVLTGDDTTQVETGHTDTPSGTETVETVGPATIHTGVNGADTVYVPAGTVNTNTITHVRRNTATTTTRTYTTTQFVLIGPGPVVVGSGQTTFTSSSRTLPVLNVVNATADQERSATRVVGTFGGTQYDLTLDVPYDPADPTIRAAIASAQAAVRAAGAKSGHAVVGAPVRDRVGTTAAVAPDQTVTGDYAVTTLAPFTQPGGPFQVNPPQPGEVNTDSGVIEFIGPTVYLTNDDLTQLLFVASGDTSVDIFTERTATTTRTRTVTETFQTTTTIEVIGGDALRLRAVGADVGGGPRVRAVRPDGTVAVDAFVYEPTFLGGVRVATGDVTGDGTDDVLTAAGDGGGPRVVVLDGATGAVVRNYFAFDDTLRVGAFVAAAAVTGDGAADYLVGAGAGGGPRVSLFDGATGARVLDFLAFDAADRHGVTVALGDVTGDGVAEVVVGQLGGGSRVRVFDLAGRLVSEFDAYEPGFTGGVYLAVADTDGDGTTELVTGAGNGGGPRVRGLRATEGGAAEVANGFRFDAAGRGGVRVGSGVGDAGEPLVLLAAGGRVKVAGVGIEAEESPFGAGYVGGLWVS